MDRDSLWSIVSADGMPPKLLRLIKANYALGLVRVTKCPLRFAPTFDRDALSPLPSLIK